MQADLRHFYGIDLKRAIGEMPATELAGYIDNLPPDSATARAELGDLADWSLLASNVADLVDLMYYWLSSEYLKWITDPDDPEVKRQQAERRKSGRKPPPFPLIPPVAARPPSLAAAKREQFDQLAAEHGVGAGGDGPGVEIRPGVRRVSSDEFDALLGI